MAGGWASKQSDVAIGMAAGVPVALDTGPRGSSTIATPPIVRFLSPSAHTGASACQPFAPPTALAT